MISILLKDKSTNTSKTGIFYKFLLFDFLIHFKRFITQLVKILKLLK